MERSNSNEGFTLVELMITVAVLAILSGIATISFRKYSRRAKTSEAVSMLGTIRTRQESYRSEYSQYCDVSSGSHTGADGSIAAFWPSSNPGTTAADWSTGLPAEWSQLGVTTSGPVYFRYATVAGNPGVTPNILGNDLHYGASPNQDAWFAVDAVGDLDADGVRSTFQVSSLSDGLWQNQETE